MLRAPKALCGVRLEHPFREACVCGGHHLKRSHRLCYTIWTY